MIKIRRNVFETNSSMTHSLVLMSPDEYNEWKLGQLYIHRWFGKKTMMTYDDVVKELRAKGRYIDHLNIDEINELALCDLDMVCLQSWLGDTAYLEHFHTNQMVGNQLVHAFGYYGHD